MCTNAVIVDDDDQDVYTGFYYNIIVYFATMNDIRWIAIIPLACASNISSVKRWEGLSWFFSLIFRGGIRE